MTTQSTPAHNSSQPAATPDQPVKRDERIRSLDLIRGIAVLGILFANITAFGQPYMAYFYPPALVEGATASDEGVWLFQLIFVDHKFRALFSILFGAGLYLFMERAWARGASRWLQFRRLLWLGVFGLMHYFLLWQGDILSAYAVTGIIALAFLKWSAKWQLRVGIGLYVFGFLLMALAMGGQILASNSQFQVQLSEEQRREITEAPTKMLAEAEREAEIISQGGYLDTVKYRVTEKWTDLLTEVFAVPFTETLALLLIGMGLYRRGFFGGEWDPVKMRRWGWIGIIGGLLATAPVAWWPYSRDFPLFETMAAFNAFARIGQLPIALGLAALLIVYGPRILETPLGARFAAAGRMAFSNYLGTSLLMMFVFHGWALGLFGQLGRLELMLVVFATWLAMLLWSAWWLARFRYGPLEWVWRCLTYGKLFALKL